jgi:hypothetical protein
VQRAIVTLPARSVAIHQDSEWFILDNLTDVPARDSERTDYQPLTVLDYKGGRRYLPAFWVE